MSPGTLDVAVACDTRYLRHSAAMLNSLARSQRDVALRVHLLHGSDLSPRRLAPLRAMLQSMHVALETHLIPASSVAGLPAWGRIPVTMWDRVLLPRLLPDLERILYLDVDVVVVDSLDGLRTIELDDFYVAAVTNVPPPEMLGHAQQLGLPGPEHYFNSGVLLMNLELMRRDGCSEALLECARARAHQLLWPDQDALNLILSPRRRALHPRWNMMNSLRRYPWSRELLDPSEVDQAIADPAIVHFEGPLENKPWHLLCDHPHRALYRQARRQTPWPCFLPEGITRANLVELSRRRLSATARRRARA